MGLAAKGKMHIASKLTISCTGSISIMVPALISRRITSYNVCYTKLLRSGSTGSSTSSGYSEKYRTTGVQGSPFKLPYNNCYGSPSKNVQKYKSKLRNIIFRR